MNLFFVLLQLFELSIQIGFNSSHDIVRVDAPQAVDLLDLLEGFALNLFKDGGIIGGGQVLASSHELTVYAYQLSFYLSQTLV